MTGKGEEGDTRGYIRGWGGKAGGMWLVMPAGETLGLWGAGRRTSWGLRAEVSGSSAPSFILPFQPMSAWLLTPSSPGQPE